MTFSSYLHCHGTRGVNKYHWSRWLLYRNRTVFSSCGININPTHVHSMSFVGEHKHVCHMVGSSDPRKTPAGHSEVLRGGKERARGESKGSVVRTPPLAYRLSYYKPICFPPTPRLVVVRFTKATCLFRSPLNPPNPAFRLRHLAPREGIIQSESSLSHRAQMAGDFPSPPVIIREAERFTP